MEEDDLIFETVSYRALYGKYVIVEDRILVLNA